MYTNSIFNVKHLKVRQEYHLARHYKPNNKPFCLEITQQYYKNIENDIH